MAALPWGCQPLPGFQFIVDPSRANPDAGREGFLIERAIGRLLGRPGVDAAPPTSLTLTEDALPTFERAIELLAALGGGEAAVSARALGLWLPAAKALELWPGVTVILHPPATAVARLRADRPELAPALAELVWVRRLLEVLDHTIADPCTFVVAAGENTGPAGALALDLYRALAGSHPDADAIRRVAERLAAADAVLGETLTDLQALGHQAGDRAESLVRDVAVARAAAAESDAARCRTERDLADLRERMIATLLAVKTAIPQAIPQLVPAIAALQTSGAKPVSYRHWVALYDGVAPEDGPHIARWLAAMPAAPEILVLIPNRGGDLAATLDSLSEQAHAGWRAVVLGERAATFDDPRIAGAAVADGDWAAALNAELGRSGAALVAVLPAGDRLTPDALALFAALAGDFDAVYADHDCIGADGARAGPCFKPDWNPDLALSGDYIGPAVAFRRTAALAVGGFGAAHTYDLLLRLIEREAAIGHLPHILLHRGPEAGDEGATLAAAQRHLARRGVGAEATMAGLGRHRVRYPLPARRPLVSVVIPTRDRADLLRNCVGSLLGRTAYADLEVVVMDNGSVAPDALEALTAIGRDPRCLVVREDGPFNFSRLNNIGVARASGAILCLLNNDTVVCDPGWLDELVGHALRPEVGIVGPKLLYPNDTIQFGGGVVGINNGGGHAFVGLPRDAAGYCGRALMTQNYAFVTGACMVLRRAVYDEVGGFDAENLPVIGNDVDLCFRIALRGYRVVWTPFAEIYHLENASRAIDGLHERSAAYRRENDFMGRRWGHRLAHDPCYNPNLTATGTDFALAAPPRTRRPWRT